MIEHANIRLTDSRTIKFALLIGWRDEAKQLGLTETEFISKKVEKHWGHSVSARSIKIVEVK